MREDAGISARPLSAATWLLAAAAILLAVAPGRAWAAEAAGTVGVDDADPFEKQGHPGAEAPPLPDPLRPMNKAFYHVNDKLYYWVLRPVARGYKALVPRPARVSIRNLFSNLGAPGRSINCLLQGDLKGSCTELARFATNTTIGVLGLGDPAKHWLKLKLRDEDFGQTLGVWGLGMGFYLTWPLMGPSCPRDTLGALVNAALDPATFLPGASLLARINNTSLTLGDYEDFKKSALDHYTAIRDAYNQHRRHAVKSWD